MKISRLSLKNFRNYSTRDFSFDPELTLIVGPNGAGKTNILEAIYLLATGRSWRTDDVGEMVRFGEEVGHVEGKISNGDMATLLITLTRGMVQGKRSSKLHFKLHGVPKRKSDVVGQLKIVLFEPESLEIVIGDPSHRRTFLDETLSQTDSEYRNDLHIYEKSLRVRNRLLDAIREGKARLEQLDYWERAMVKHGSKIQESRVRLIDWVNGNLATKGQTLQGLTFLELEYDSSPISDERLDQYREREIAAGFTLVGPQRDDVKIATSEKRLATREDRRELAQFGSRGEQRMAVLKLKLAEARWIEEQTGDSPVLLLDDIYSELDDEHDQMVAELVQGRQTIITATEKPSGHYASDQVIRL